jgi:signal transduction histidine kinase
MELAAPGARPRSGHFDRWVVRGAGCVLVALAAAAAAAAITASSDRSSLEALARALIVGVPTAVGLGTVSRTGNDRFGLLLAGLGGALLLATLATSDDELAYTIGRAAGWFVEVLLVYLILAFPTGRLPGRTDRVLVGAMAAVVLTMFVPRLALAEHFEVPSPYTTCAGDCPANAFLLVDHEPAFVEAFMRPAGALLVVALSAAALLRLRERIREASPVARRMLVPVLAIGMVRMALLGVGLAARQADPSAWPIEVLAWSLALAPPAIALALLFAILRWELQAGRALEQLAEWLPEAPDRATLRRVLADAFGDPTLQIVLPAEGRPDEPAPGQAVSEVGERGAVVATVIHDDALQASPRLLDAGLAMAGVVLENQRLAADAETATRELRGSRARIAATAERERRRIERDLHDGAQQRLVAIRIELELAEEVVRRDPGEGIGRLRELEHEVDEALDDLRSLAHGVYPPLLADRGLAEALEPVAARSSIPVEIEACDIGRYAPEVESAVYFCVLEALQNVLKHAAGARRAVVRLDGGSRSELRFSVRDDGRGAEAVGMRAGAGITNMRDRLAAVGGEVSFASVRAVGTTVRGRVPTPTAK